VRERFVSEEIRPLPGHFDSTRMSAGEPGLPERFLWRDEEIAVAALLESWKQLSPRTRDGDDRYLRRHWYRIRSSDGREMKLYFERKARPGGRMGPRWYLYTLMEPGEEA